MALDGASARRYIGAMSLLHDLTLGQYVPVDSPVHRLDPRTKLCGTMLLMAVLMIIRDLRFYPIVLIWLAGVVRVAGLPPTMVVRNLRPFIWLLTITFVAHALLTPGRSAGPVGIAWLGLTAEGLTQGTLFTVRLMTIILLASVLTLTTTPIEVADGLEALLKPFQRIGVPAHELAMMTVIALRFIPTLVEEADRLQKAQMARGADFTGSPIRRARKFMALLIPLILSAFRRADDLAVAMEARCYRGSVGRTQFRALRLAGPDYLALGLTAGLAACGWWFI